MKMLLLDQIAKWNGSATVDIIIRLCFAIELWDVGVLFVIEVDISRF